jgi:hypothetical protein
MSEELSQGCTRALVRDGDRCVEALFAPGCVNWHNTDKLSTGASFGGAGAPSHPRRLSLRDRGCARGGALIRIVARRYENYISSSPRDRADHERRRHVWIDDYVDLVRRPAPMQRELTPW